MCKSLIVGVHSDESITYNKGPPVTTLRDREVALRACKWVDEVVPRSPYNTSMEWLNKYGCYYVIHGDDASTDANGADTYRFVKAAGRFKECERTDGISTTNVITRLLRNPKTQPALTDWSDNKIMSLLHNMATDETGHAPKTAVYEWRNDGLRELVVGAKKGGKIVYVAGEWDLLTTEHLLWLESIRKQHLDAKLVVGIYSDAGVVEFTGSAPVLNHLERTLMLLSVRYPDVLLIGPPPNANSIDLSPALPQITTSYVPTFEEFKNMGISTARLKSRILENQALFEVRQKKKNG